MNTNEHYEHQPDRPSHQVRADAAPVAEVSPLAVHGDPSQTAPARSPQSKGSGKSVQWVRPNELPALVGGRYVRFGIDAQSELVRRARRTPARAVSRARVRISRTAIGHTDALNPREGGIGL